MDHQDPNCCRICLANKNEDGFVSLFTDEELSTEGRMYMDLFGIKILDDEIRTSYPQYLCNSCDLQMKLFMKLKIKAEKTNKLLREKYDVITAVEYIDNHDVQHEIKIEIPDTEETHYDDEPTPHEEIDIKICFNELNNGYINAKEEINKFTIKQLDTETDESTVYSDYAYLNNSSKELHEDSDFHNDVQYLDDYDEFCDFEKLEDEYEEVEKKLKQDDSENNAEKLNFDCKMCTQKFPSSRLLTQHKKKVHGKSKRIKCPQCLKTVNSEESYNVHMNLHQGLPAYSCSLCERTFNQKAHFKYHMANHLNERNVKCEVCGKGFVTKSDLKIHMRSHTDERRYQCDVCGKEFRAYSHMKNHRYSHFEKEFECSFCLQKYISPSTLRTHVKSIHMGEAPYQCEKCERKFKRKHHLTNHIKTHQKRENSDGEF